MSLQSREESWPVACTAEGVPVELAPDASPHPSRTVKLSGLWIGLAITLLAVWLLVFLQTDSSHYTAIEKLQFLLLGIGGAIIANATGVGGGIVFVPVFSFLSFTDSQILGTSIAIQCFGMSMGTLSYQLSRSLQAGQRTVISNRLFATIVALVTLPSIAGGQLVELMPLEPLSNIHLLFKISSIALGLALAFFLLRLNRSTTRQELTGWDYAILPLIGFLGGILTGWISVGVGEFLAVYLFVRRLPAIDVIALAVTVSALTVLSLVPFHVIAQTIDTGLLIFASLGALAGGFIARLIITNINPDIVKWICCLWVLLAGVLT
jgi:uncharacterized membrane protein YfcA